MKAGFSETDITPPVGVYLAGYPGRDERSTGVRDPLFLRIVALEDDAGEQAALVTSDLLKYPRDMIWRTKAWCEKELGLKSAALLINSSHTHCSPGLFPQECYPQWPVDIEYVRRLEGSIRRGIEAALRDLKPARIRLGVHQAHFGVCRRLPAPELGGKVRMAPNENGYYDPDMPIMAFYTGDAQTPRAVLYSYACHPTSLSGLQISADWPGEISRGLKKALGGGVITLFAQGAAGSVGPRKFPGCATPQEISDAWGRIAADMAGFVASGKMRDIELRLRPVEKEFLIPYDMQKALSPDELMALSDPANETIKPECRPANRSIMREWARAIYEKMRTNTLDSGFRMHLTRIGLNDKLQIIGLSGEVTAEVGRMIKDAFPDKETVFLGYCSYTDAYIPAAKMLDAGGHEALASIYFHMRPAPFVKEIDEIITREVLSLGA